MKSFPIFFCVAFCSLLFTTCDQQPNHQEPNLVQLKSDMQAVETAWAKAMNAQDINSLMAMYTDDAISMGCTALRNLWERKSPNMVS